MNMDKDVYKMFQHSGKYNHMHLERKIWQILLPRLNHNEHATV